MYSFVTSPKNLVTYVCLKICYILTLLYGSKYKTKKGWDIIKCKRYAPSLYLKTKLSPRTSVKHVNPKISFIFSHLNSFRPQYDGVFFDRWVVYGKEVFTPVFRE